MANNTDSYQFFNRSQQINYSYFEFENIIYAHGLCGNLQLPPMQRSCTPPLHIHLDQTEFFTLLQGQLVYQLGDKVYSCDIHTNRPKNIVAFDKNSLKISLAPFAINTHLSGKYFYFSKMFKLIQHLYHCLSRK